MSRLQVCHAVLLLNAKELMVLLPGTLLPRRTY